MLSCPLIALQRALPNKRMQMTAAGSGVHRPWSAAAGSRVERARGVRSVLGWCARSRSSAAIRLIVKLWMVLLWAH
jgi:hypothetical protein